MSATPKRKHTGNGNHAAEQRRWARMMLRKATPAPTDAVALLAAADALVEVEPEPLIRAAWYECESLAPSGTATAGRVYRVDIDLETGELRCDCPQARNRGDAYCKHVMMALALGCGPYHVALTDPSDPHGWSAEPLPPGLAAHTPINPETVRKATRDLAEHLERLAERQEQKRLRARAATRAATNADGLDPDDLYGGREHLATKDAERERRELSRGAATGLPPGFEPGRRYTRAEWLELVRGTNAGPASTGQAAVAR